MQPMISLYHTDYNNCYSGYKMKFSKLTLTFLQYPLKIQHAS